MNKLEWIYCPLCKHKTHTKIRKDTELIHFPLYCPKCRKETLINVKELNLTKIEEPDAKMQMVIEIILLNINKDEIEVRIFAIRHKCVFY
ncbi:hypothetical protein FZX01_15750 [Listeria monocytogenes]|uniref:cysteine-rich KTR domain-containing protein n=1 Tax=Listeria monocytogenes TaxID=1639 RepID=UPI0011EA83B9|nr:hypothetical protein FZX01_15750 [Listeria monocytogenes]